MALFDTTFVWTLMVIRANTLDFGSTVIGQNKVAFEQRNIGRIIYYVSK
jgi:hypothetical protein